MKVAVALVLFIQAAAQDDGCYDADGCSLRGECWKTTVVHDTATGWNDGCLGLDKVENITSSDDCKDVCTDDIKCSVWQWVKAKTGDLQCWTGNIVHGCQSRSGNVTDFDSQNLIAGQRLQHGDVKVVSTDSGQETTGLKKYLEKTGTDEEKIARCKLACYTDVSCSVWQYAMDGCWYETTMKGNFTKGEVKTDSPFAKAMKNGETIEHICPPKPDDIVLGLWVIAGIVLALLALCACLYFLCAKKPKVKKTRAVKIEPKPQPQQIMYFVPQPTVLIPQTSVVQVPQYQPVVQSAPMTSYTTNVMAPTTMTSPTVVTTGASASTQPLIVR